MSDDDLKALGRRQRERDAARDAWAAGEDDLLAPLSADEMARLQGAVHAARPAPRPRRGWMWGGALAAAAAALLVVLFPTTPPTELAPYGIELRSRGFSSVRSATVADAWTYAPGMVLEVVLRPSTAGVDAVEAAAFVLEDAGPRRLDWAPEITPQGVVRFRAEVGGALSLPPGEHRLLFVVGSPGGATPDRESARTFERTLTIREAPSP